MELTIEKYLKYPFCPVMVSGEIDNVINGAILENGVCNVIAIVPEGWLYVSTIQSKEHGSAFPSQCKLLLTPPEKIGDDDAIEIAKIMGWKESLKSWGKWYCQSGFPNNCTLNAMVQNKITDFLRSKYYDVDNAIQDGWAIDKTTLPTS